MVLRFILPLLLALPAHAGNVDAQYTLSLRGITGGQIAIRGADSGASYSVSSAAKATGLVGALVKYGFEGRAQGQIRDGRYISTTYSEVEVDDGERTVATTEFNGTTPASVTFDPARAPEPHDIDPTAQQGVVDPLTALYAVLQPVAPDAACDRRFDLFDGRHVSRLTLGAPRETGGTVTCPAEYRRLRGYSAEQLAKREAVEMTFVFTPVAGGRVQVGEIRSDTSLGQAVLRRQ